MRCPSCDHDNRPERRFCAECGARLGAAHEMREAHDHTHLLEDHRNSDSRTSLLTLSNCLADEVAEEVIGLAG